LSRIKNAKALHRKYDAFYEHGLEKHVVRIEGTKGEKQTVVPYSSVIVASRLLWSSPVHCNYITPSQNSMVRSKVKANHELDIRPGCRLFNCTPLAHFPVKVSRVCTFNKKGHEYKIGDFCEVKINRNICVCRIDALSYKRWIHEDLNHPYPYIEVTYSQLVRARRGISNANVDVQSKEYFLVAGSNATSTIDEVMNPFSMRIFERDDPVTDWPISGEEGMIRYKRLSQRRGHYRYEPYRHPFYKFDYEEDGKHTTYISLFVDGFTTSSQNQSTTGVYMNWLNADGSVRNCEAFLHPLMLIPPGVDQYEALHAIRRDVKLMEQGLRLFSYQHSAVIDLQLFIALLSLDLMGAYPLLRHGGNKCLMNCCGCLSEITGRLDFEAPLEKPRRVQLTDLCVEQIIEVGVKMVEERAEKDKSLNLPQQTSQLIRQRYGVLPEKNPFEGLTLDPHAQYFRCTSHMILYGLFRHLFRFLWDKWHTPLMRFAVQASLVAVDDPENLAARLQVQRRDGITGSLSMEEVRGLSLLLTSCFDGLLKPELLNHFRQLWSVYSQSTGPNLLTGAELAHVQEVCSFFMLGAEIRSALWWSFSYWNCSIHAVYSSWALGL
jgi:hypothetical protein